MNFLAHAYLSFKNPEVLVGNLISDFVKGKKMYDYPVGIQAGIALHRAIDSFTDVHSATASAKQLFRPYYRLYSGAFVDVVYDHFLATDQNIFTDSGLRSFTRETYAALDQYQAIFPANFARMYPYMKKENWLYHYRENQGIQNSFAGLTRRAAYISDSTHAYTVFQKHYDGLKNYYRQFFPDLKNFAFSTFSGLNLPD